MNGQERQQYREPVVAGRFYPADPGELRRTLAGLIPTLTAEQRQEALAAVVPHAGYVYSGAVAGETLARLRLPGTVLLLGPNHHGRGAPAALDRRCWRTPLGEVPVDQELAARILAAETGIVLDETAHDSEHSLEVQVPLLQWLRADISLVPIVLGHLRYEDCQLVARTLADAIRGLGRPVLLVASTDMSHYVSREQAARKDGRALERLQALDPAGLYRTVHELHISMCGVVPTTVALLAALELGARQAQLVRYTDSGAVSGDTAQVVGYAGAIIT
ncbi:MAG: AmmeMemoRadiSam system protein B [Desulfobulbaceae bacterium A2]|nr:MAG: AmmeMemoRadiSam system protein B [Desulfobulbaceae bacterium A2]